VKVPCYYQKMSAMRATRESWQTNGMPENKSLLKFTRHFSLAEFNRLSLGLVPEQMEDKWFIFFEEPGLFFHRSWTGDCIFKLLLQPDGDGYCISEAWVNRDPHQYNSSGPASDIEWLTKLVERLVLDKP
jgi:hypothetical protein